MRGATRNDNLSLGIVAITAFFALIVVIHSAIKYRDTGREIVWALIPFFISIGILVWASIVFFHIVRGGGQNTSPK
jgi:hypothetical protein